MNDKTTKCIDTHVHISLFDGNAQNLAESFQILVDDMQKNNIEKAIIIPDNIENSDHIADLDTARALVGKKKNFFFLGSPHIMHRGSGELEKYHKLLENNIVVGLKFFPGHDPYYPHDERCIPYYALCEKMGAPVVFHTGENTGDHACAQWNDPKYIVEIAKQFPQLKVIITHYFWPQMAYCYEITKDVKNIYFETAAMADDEVVQKSGGREAVQKILQQTVKDRTDKVLFGTDWPMCSMEKQIDLITSLQLPQDIEEKILRTNAIDVYNL